MPGRKCSLCEKPSHKGFMSVYSAWFPEPDRRVAFKSLYCVDCAPDLLAEMEMMHKAVNGLDPDEVAGCHKCGLDVNGVWCTTWLTVYAPKHERFDWETWNCQSCAVAFQAQLRATGTPLGERARDASVSRQLVSPWSSIGLT